MKIMPFAVALLWWLVALAGSTAAQTLVAPPVVRQPAVAETVVTERVPARVVEEVLPVVAPAVVTARPIVREAIVAPTRTVTWWDALARMRYGFYDDGFADDNWFYDYYDGPPTTVAVEQPVAAAPGGRTSWRYDPQVEQRLFRW